MDKDKIDILNTLNEAQQLHGRDTMTKGRYIVITIFISTWGNLMTDKISLYNKGLLVASLFIVIIYMFCEFVSNYIVTRNVRDLHKRLSNGKLTELETVNLYNKVSDKTVLIMMIQLFLLFVLVLLQGIYYWKVLM